MSLLADILVADQRLGISLLEDGKTFSNHIVYEPHAFKRIFLHAKEVLKEDANFDLEGRPVIQNSLFQDSTSPFTEKAYALVDYYLSPSSLQERMAMASVNAVPMHLMEPLIVERLQKRYPKMDAAAIYQAELDKAQAQRHAELANIPATAQRHIETMREFLVEGYAFASLILALVKEEMQPYLELYQKQKNIEISLPQSLEELEANQESLRAFLEWRVEIKHQVPIVVLASSVMQKLLLHMMERYDLLYCEAQDALLSAYRSILEDRYKWLSEDTDSLCINGLYVERILKKANPQWAARYIGEMKAYHYDPEQALNLIEGLRALGNEAEHVAVEDIILAGRQRRVHQTLVALTKPLANPFHGRIPEKERDIAEQIAEFIPGHMLQSAIDFGTRVIVNRSDRSFMQMRHPLSEITTAGGYDRFYFDHPCIDLSPDLGDCFGEPYYGFAEIARHEFRHAILIQHGLNKRPELIEAFNLDKTHFAEIQNAGSESMQNLAKLLPEDMTLKEAMDRVESRCRVWLEYDSSKVALFPEEYSTIYAVREEIMPRIDELSVKLGMPFMSALFPNIVGLMQAWDKEMIAARRPEQAPRVGMRA